MIIDALILSLLISLAFFDFKERRLPNGLVLLLFCLGIYTAWQDATLISNLITGLVVGGLFYFLKLYYHSRKNIDALGLGDVKLIGAIGVLVGFLYVPLVIFLGSAATLFYAFVYKLRGNNLTPMTRLPLGAFLALSTGIILVVYKYT